MQYWQNKVVLVTGGSSGLGECLARTFARAGAKLVLAAIDGEGVAAVAASLREMGTEAIGVLTDVTKQADVDRLLERALEQYGRLDVLANCAGRSTRGEALATTPDQFRDLLELNFLATVRCARAAVPHLIQSRGHLINIGSLAAKTASRYLGAYPASKFPVAAYSQQLRYELNPQGVHVLLVCPGPIARPDAGRRYDQQADGLPESARRPGAGVKLRGIPPEKLTANILRYCERRKPELIMPRKARLLFAVSQLWPTFGDWIIGKMTPR
jgi:NAD(P)-dependent dehydrogenase (short-subunit alcohol dehydrogenase family)